MQFFLLNQTAGWFSFIYPLPRTPKSLSLLLKCKSKGKLLCFQLLFQYIQDIKEREGEEQEGMEKILGQNRIIRQDSSYLIILFYPIQLYPISIGQNWMRQDRTGQVRTRQDRTVQDRIGQDRIGQNKTGQDRKGQYKIEQDRIGQDRIGQYRIGQDGTAQDRIGQDRI